MSDDSGILKQFDGVVRLFPLPNVVLFPQVIQPLHIFEPRYREMTSDALAGDRLIAPVLLCPGWEADYDGRPAVHEILCVGRIVADQQMPDGRFNLLLRGVSRARIIEEIPSPKLYRSAQVELLTECSALEVKTARRLRSQVGKAARGWFPAKAPAGPQLHQLLKNPDLPLGTLCDLLGFAVPLPIEAKQRLLEQLDVAERVALLLDFLAQGPPGKDGPDSNRPFPPDFSSN